MSQRDAEAFWSERYASTGDEFYFGTAPAKFLPRQARRLKPGLKALSLADGEGRNSVFLAEEGLTVTAVELSPVALHKAARLATERHVEVEFVRADILKWQWPVGAYDVVLAVFIQFLSPDERAVAFRRMVEALKSGGLLLLHGYTPKQIEYRTGGPSAVENLYTEALLRESFPDLEILELREYEDVLEEGTGHKGLSAVIDLVAVKPAN